MPIDIHEALEELQTFCDDFEVGGCIQFFIDDEDDRLGFIRYRITAGSDTTVTEILNLIFPALREVVKPFILVPARSEQ